MSTSISASFLTQWSSDVFVAYQRQGSLLRGTVREQMINPGETAKFHKYGTGAVGARGQHGLVPVMNATHSVVSVTVSDYYGGEYIDDLDTLKTNIDERLLAANALAAAAGRKVDERIIAVAGTSVPAANQIALAATGFTKTKALKLVFLRFQQDIPEDGQTFALIGAQQWADLLDIPEFKSRDYMTSLPWTQGYAAASWLGITWIMHTGLTVASLQRTCLAWHRPAMGLAMVADLRPNFDWIAERAAYFSQVRISMEAVSIEDNGRFSFICQEV